MRTISQRTFSVSSSGTISIIDPYQQEHSRPEDRQSHPRRSTLVAARLVTADRQVNCAIVNVSTGGVRIQVKQALEAQGTASLQFDDRNSVAVEVIWQENDLVGLQFTDAPGLVCAFLYALEQSEPSMMEQRRYQRYSVLWCARVLCGGRTDKAVVLDLSVTGAKVWLLEPAILDQNLTLSIYQVGDLAARLVWRKDRNIGVEFLDPVEQVAEVVGDALPIVREELGNHQDDR